MKDKLYVTMTDKFITGLGVTGKIDKFVIECDNWDQAEQAVAGARRRPEMKYINLNTRKPYYNWSRYTVTVEHYNDLGDIWTDGKYKTDGEAK